MDPTSSLTEIDGHVCTITEPHGVPEFCWLMSTRIASQIVEDLRPLLVGPEQQTTSIEDLTGLFGVPVELVTDLPQGAVLRG